MLHILKLAVSVPFALFLLIGVGFWVMRRRTRLGRILVASGFSALLLLSIPWCAAALLRSLQGEPVDASSLGKDARAIVVLSADAVSYAPEFGRPTVGRLTLERLRYGAYLARRSELPLLVAGGASRPGIASRGELMREALEEGFGVAVRWVEGSSTDTLGNARGAAELLGQEGIDRIALVTHAWHMPRAVQAFESTGLLVLAAPTAFRDWPEARWTSCVPSARSLQESSWAVHEWIGRAWYTLR